MLIGLIILLLLMIGLLAIPVTVKFQVSWQKNARGNIELLWMFGFVRARFEPFRLTNALPSKEESAQKSKHVEGSTGKPGNVISVIRQKALRRRIITFIRDIWYSVHKQNISLRIRIGLGDPADTGQLWAAIGPMSGILANIEEVLIEIEPEFFDSTFELDSSGNIRLIPLQMLYLTIGLFLSPIIWQGIIQMHKVV